MQFMFQQLSPDEYRLWLKISEQEKKADPADEAFFSSERIARMLFDKRLTNGHDLIVSWTFETHDGMSALERVTLCMSKMFESGAEEIVDGPAAVNFFVGFVESFNG